MVKVLGYVPGVSIIHNMHPLTKLIWLMGGLVLSLLLGVRGLAIGVVVIFAMAEYTGVWSPSKGYYQFLLFFAGIVVVLSLLFTKEGTAFWSDFLGTLAPTDEGLYIGFVTGLRMVFVAGVFPIFLGTTEPRDIVTTLVENLKVPYDYAFMFTSALRFVPILLEEIDLIDQAQRARGFKVSGRGPLARLRAYGPIAVPLVLSSLARAENMAVAMETRGYGSGPRTYYYSAPMVLGDIFALGLLSVLILMTALQ